MRYQHVCIESLGYTLPEEVVTSDEIERRLRLSISACGCRRAGWN